MKKHNLRGTGTVFRYTMQQHYKTRSVVIFLAILFILSLAAFPLIAKFSGNQDDVTETSITKLYLRNETGFSLTEDDIHADSRYAKLAVEETTLDKEGLREMLNKEQDGKSIAAVIEADSLTGGFKINGYYGKSGQIDQNDAGTLSGVLKDALHESMLKSLNITADQEQTVKSTAVTMVQLEEEFNSGEETTSTDVHQMVSGFYSYAVLLLSTLAMSYIFQLCMEEKTSKLVESLLVSVKPMALLVGKIVAVTCFIFIGLGLIFVGFFISYQITRAMGEAQAEAALGSISKLFNMDFSTLKLGIGMAVLLVVSVVLAYSIAAAFSGIVGSCCSKTEDLQHASVAVVLFLMLGYFTASFAPMFESDTANAVFSIFPLTSMFVALPNYVCGKIGMPVFLIGIVLQGVTAFLLARLAGSVYSMMILYRGGFPKMKQVISMLRENRAAEKAAAGREANHES